MNKNILLFGGTTEGNLLAQGLCHYPVRQYISVATDYGKTCAGSYENAEVLTGRMDRDQIAELIREKAIDCVIDATHPFARKVTEEIRSACIRTDTEYIRCLREEKEEDGRYGKHIVIETESVQEAVSRLEHTEGNIFITTGSKELEAYTLLPDYKERCFVRVLSVKESLEKSISLGFEGKHLIAMQGPFSREMNTACIRQTNAKYFVTKESGDFGGFHEKLEAARETGAVLIIIRRPEETGISVSEILRLLHP